MWISGFLDGRLSDVNVSESANRVTSSASAQFNVFKPQYSFSGTMASGFSFTSSSPTQGKFVFAQPGQDGITFRITSSQEPPLFSGGTLEWVQIVNSSTFSTYYNDGTKPNIETLHGLDVTYPYLARDSMGNPVDSPALDYDTASVLSEHIEADFTMYLLWLPPAAAGSSDWVPLKKLHWSVNAVAQYNKANNGAKITSQSATPDFGKTAQSVLTLQYPTWEKVVWHHG